MNKPSTPADADVARVARLFATHGLTIEHDDRAREVAERAGTEFALFVGQLAAFVAVDLLLEIEASILAVSLQELIALARERAMEHEEKTEERRDEEANEKPRRCGAPGRRCGDGTCGECREEKD